MTASEMLPSKHEGHHNSRAMETASCMAYASFSIAMVLGNKYITASVPLVDRDSIPDMGVIWFQCVLAVLILEVAKFAGFITYPGLNYTTVKSWLPINLMFIGMLYTGFMSFVYLSVPIITIMKNLTNVFTVFGDFVFFHQTPTWSTAFSIILMTFGAIMAGANDLQFSWIGYVWMVMNCLLTSAYTLYMRHATVNINLPKLGMVYYNNLLSALLLTPVCYFVGDLQKLQNPSVFNSTFVALNVLTGMFGVCLNFSSLWCVGTTSATTYAIVGSLCKIPITVLGFVLFDAPVTAKGLGFIVLGTMGGLLYGYSKLPSSNLITNTTGLSSK
jgi:GDP-mannose transporter